MFDAICNTSPILYLYRISAIEFLPKLFDTITTTSASVSELKEGLKKGFDVPTAQNYKWLTIRNPKAIPSEWFSLDLGPGELHALSLGLENRDHILLLDDLLARRTAQAAGLTVWGTLRVLLEAKNEKIIGEIKPHVSKLRDAGLWFSDEIFNRILNLAKEQS